MGVGCFHVVVEPGRAGYIREIRRCASVGGLEVESVDKDLASFRPVECTRRVVGRQTVAVERAAVDTADYAVVVKSFNE